MNKRERLEHTIADEPTDRTPVALWRRFPGDDQRAGDFARAVVEFQRAYDWDFVNVCPSPSYMVIDYGAQDAWHGSDDGTRTITRRVITRSLDWTSLRALDPTRGALGRVFDTLTIVGADLGEETPISLNILSPLAQAELLAGREQLIRHLRMEPDRLHSGLSILTETTMRFIEALRRVPVAGIAYSIWHGSYAVLPEDEYRVFGLAYDRKILETLPSRWWLNLVQFQGDSPMFKFARELPSHVVNWHDQTAEPTLAQGKTLFDGAVCGGLDATEHLQFGTPTTIRDAARDAAHITGARRFILSAGEAAVVTTPLSNLRAAREAVEGL